MRNWSLNILCCSKLRRRMAFHKPRLLSPLGTVRSYFEDSKLLNFANFYENVILSSGGNQYARFSTLLNSRSFSSLSEVKENKNGLGVEIISIENVKPSSPTPHGLRTYEISFLDQLCQNLYMPSIYFYLNNDEHATPQLITKRRQVLKQSLSETLTRFYPLAGKVKGDRFIDCNDEGVYYVEAKVNDPISDVLEKPDNKPMHELLPFEPTSPELLSKTSNYVTLIKATVFSCGGIAIGVCTSHKIIDGYSLATFVTAWAATARGSSKNICPSFTSPSIFLPHPSLDSKGTAETFHADDTHGKKVTTRFVFSAASIKTLKTKAEAPSRVMAVTGLIWKCSMAARGVALKSCSTLLVAVNIRERSSPPLPPFSIGNIVLPAIAQCKENYDLLPFVVGLLKTATDQVNSDNIETIKGKDGYKRGLLKYFEPLKKLTCSNPNTLFITLSSMCNREIYEADFGWGKPIWARVASTDSDSCVAVNMIYLLDTRDGGGGIEAFVTLSERDMRILERDTELRSYATVNPSPLRTTHA